MVVLLLMLKTSQTRRCWFVVCGFERVHGTSNILVIFLSCVAHMAAKKATSWPMLDCGPASVEAVPAGNVTIY